MIYIDRIRRQSYKTFFVLADINTNDKIDKKNSLSHIC